MSRIQITDQQWAFIQPLFPRAARTGRPRANDRIALAQTLGDAGIWEHIWRSAVSLLDMQGMLD
jgi:transposase